MNSEKSDLEAKKADIEKNKIEYSNIKIPIPNKSEESLRETTEVANELNKVGNNNTIVFNTEGVTITINKGDNTVFDNHPFVRVVPLSTFLYFENSLNPYHRNIIGGNVKIINSNTIEVTNTLDLKENSRLSLVVNITMTGDKIKEYIDKVNAANIAREEYKKTGFKDINEAMRGVDASVSVVKGQLHTIFEKALKEFNYYRSEERRVGKEC